MSADFEGCLVRNNSALWWQCYRGNGNDLRFDGFPNTACPGGLDQAIQLYVGFVTSYFADRISPSPSCWDGVYANDGNYTGHVSESSSYLLSETRRSLSGWLKHTLLTVRTVTSAQAVITHPT